MSSIVNSNNIMADNFLEKQRANHERRKQEWLKKKKNIAFSRKKTMISRDQTD